MQAALGNPAASQTVSNGGTSIEQWVYVCMPDAQSAQQVQFVFDGNGVLFGHTAISYGPERAARADLPVTAAPPSSGTAILDPYSSAASRSPK